MAGRPPKEKSFANMLRICVMEPAEQAGVEGDPTKLRSIVERLVLNAMGGDNTAIKEIADRLDGKVPQAIVGDDDHPPVAVIERHIVDPARPSSG